MNDWIEWKGGKCPIPSDWMVDFKMRDKRNGFHSARADDLGWSHTNSGWDIVAYRVAS